jgi:LPXTG-site transpeptidase (sortase) family protein
VNTVLRGVGELLITVGIVVFLFCGYELWGTGIYTQNEQAQMKQDLHSKWNQPSSADRRARSVALRGVKTGDAFAEIRMPRLGGDYSYAVVEGVSATQLKRGPGHYPGTAWPGQKGNFVVSGHRTTYLAPFNRLNELRSGNRVIVETDRMIFTYRITTKKVVPPTDTDVILPVPNHPRQKPTKPMLTMTTCTPKYTAKKRLVVFGELAKAVDKSDRARQI